MALIDKLKTAVQTVIPSLTSGSAAAIWLRITEAMAQVMQTYTLELENTRLVLVGQATSLRVGRPDYYIQKAKEWQPDGTLAVDPDTGEWFYPETGPTLVTQAAVSVADSTITLSVAKTNTAGALEPLTEAELSALDEYMGIFSFAGLRPFLKSSPADVVSGSLAISYDPTVSLAQIKSGTLAALAALQKSYDLFDPVYVNKLEQSVEKVPGVVNAFFGTVRVDSPETGGTAFYNNRVELPAGYFNFSADLLDGSAVTYTATDNETAV